MHTPHPLHALALADRRGRELRAAAEAERHGERRRHTVLAAVLRRAADRLDPVAPLRHPHARQPCAFPWGSASTRRGRS